MSTIPLAAIFLTVVLYSVLLFALFRKVWKEGSRLRDCLINVNVLCVTVLCLFLAGEAYLKYLYLASDGFGASLQALKWNRRYKHPINSFGYRDIEHPASHIRRHKVMFVVGDSIVEGAGIKDTRDRFSDIIQNAVGDQWAIVNMGKGGWSTADEYRAIVSFPVRPDVIVLSYLVNDIEHACMQYGIPLQPFHDHTAFFRLSRRSYLADYMYWRSYRLSRTSTSYWSYLQQCFSRDNIFYNHMAELSRIVSHARRTGTDLIVVVFPFLSDIENSRALTARVVRYLNERKVRVIDVSSGISEEDASDFMVSRHDPHPNEHLNRIVANLLLEELRPLLFLRGGG